MRLPTADRNNIIVNQTDNSFTLGYDLGLIARARSNPERPA